MASILEDLLQEISDKSVKQQFVNEVESGVPWQHLLLWLEDCCKKSRSLQNELKLASPSNPIKL
jgi:hypothetical protein